MRALTSDVAATRSLAGALADLVEGGDVVLLAGELGAGKTAFAEGLGGALGIEEQIVSPTFTLARQYEGRLTMHHLDVYRLERFSELQDIGVNELVDSGGVVLIEWGDAVAPVLPPDYLEVRIAYGDGDDDRMFELRFVGSRWDARRRVVAERLADWTVT